MEAKEASEKLKKFFYEEKENRSIKKIAKMIGVSHPTLYKKMENNDFTQKEITLLVSQNIISTNPQPKWTITKSSRLRLRRT